jgi:hypothetical protein
MPGLNYPKDRTQPDEALGLTNYEKKVRRRLNPGEKKVFDRYTKGKHYHLVAWGKGYPDFTFVDSHNNLIFREVKTDYDNLSDEQQEVLSAMKASGLDVGVEQYITKTGEIRRRDELIGKP